MNKLAKLLREYRLVNNMTRTQLARKAELSENCISLFEKSRITQPRPGTMWRLSLATGIDPEVLWAALRKEV